MFVQKMRMNNIDEIDTRLLLHSGVWASEFLDSATSSFLTTNTFSNIFSKKMKKIFQSRISDFSD